jgi:hypothetical protein
MIVILELFLLVTLLGILASFTLIISEYKTLNISFIVEDLIKRRKEYNTNPSDVTNP